MLRGNRWILIVAVPIIAGLPLSACGGSSSEAASQKEISDVEPIKGTNLNKVTLSAKAAERLGIETARVRTKQVAGKKRKVIPYASVVYTPNGRAFTYTSPEPRVFVRQFIIVDSIKAREAILSHGPPAGMSVVTVGSQELFGVEYEVEED